MFWNTNTLVCDTDGNPLLIVLCRQFDVASPGRVTTGILQELCEDLGQFLAVAIDLRVCLAADLDNVVLFTVPGVGLHFFQQLPNRQVLVINPSPVCFESLDIKKPVDQFRKFLCFLGR